jgi:branched-chain amino acid transport system ATP-binding protein
VSARLEVEGLCLARGGRRVLDGVSLELEAGRTTALLGPNGAGKSSLVLAMAGLLPAASGSIRLDGRRIDGLAPHRVRAAGIAAVLEGHQVLTSLTVEENLQVAASHLGRAGAAAALERAFTIFPELEPLRGRGAGSLSGGQQQMVALAQGLAGRPAFLLADEMSFGLAPVVVGRLMRVLESVAAEGVGVLLIEQFTHLALRLAARVHVIHRGRIRFAGTPAELRGTPGVLEAAYLTAPA